MTRLTRRLSKEDRRFDSTLHEDEEETMSVHLSQKRSPQAMFALYVTMFIITGACKNKEGDPNAPLDKDEPSAGASTKGEPTIMADHTTFTYLAGGEPKAIDPALFQENTALYLDELLFTGLVRNMPNGSVLPGMAESWEPTQPDLSTTVITFHIRPDVKWMDGVPVTAQDFAYAWFRVLTPATGSPYAEFLYFIKGAKAYLESRAEDKAKGEADRPDVPESQVGIETPDGHTIRVTLESSGVAALLYRFGFVTLYPVRKDVVEKYGDKWTRPENIITNGAFSLQSMRLNDRWVLTRNPSWFDAQNVSVRSVVAITTDNETTMRNMFDSGMVQWTGMSGISPVAYPSYSTQPTFRTSPTAGGYWFEFNVSKPPFDNPKVRRAFSLAIDREAMCMVRSGHCSKTDLGRWLPNIGGYVGTVNKGFDVDQARQLLTEAGFPNGKGLPPIRFLCDNRETNVKAFEIAQAMWEKNLGVHVELDKQEWKVSLRTRTAGEYQMTRGGWYPDYPDPISFLEIFGSTNGNNFTRWKNRAYDELVTKIGHETNPQTRWQLIGQADAMVLDEDVVAPLYFIEGAELLAPGITGLTPNNLRIQRLEYVRLPSGG